MNDSDDVITTTKPQKKTRLQEKKSGKVKMSVKGNVLTTGSMRAMMAMRYRYDYNLHLSHH